MTWITPFQRVRALENDSVITRVWAKTNKSKTVIIPPGHVWLTSDAGGRGYMDSSYFGALPETEVTGVVIAVVRSTLLMVHHVNEVNFVFLQVWPPSRWGASLMPREEEDG